MFRYKLDIIYSEISMKRNTSMEQMTITAKIQIIAAETDKGFA